MGAHFLFFSFPFLPLPLNLREGGIFMLVPFEVRLIWSEGQAPGFATDCHCPAPLLSHSGLADLRRQWSREWSELCVRSAEAAWIDSQCLLVHLWNLIPLLMGKRVGWTGNQPWGCPACLTWCWVSCNVASWIFWCQFNQHSHKVLQRTPMNGGQPCLQSLRWVTVFDRRCN